MAGSPLSNGASPLPSQPSKSKRYGITKPISLAGPAEVDLLRNAELEKFLVDSGLYENKEETMKREEVLGRIDQEEEEDDDEYEEEIEDENNNGEDYGEDDMDFEDDIIDD